MWRIEARWSEAESKPQCFHEAFTVIVTWLGGCNASCLKTVTVRLCVSRCHGGHKIRGHSARVGSLLLLWVLGIQLRRPGLAASTLTCWGIWQARVRLLRCALGSRLFVDWSVKAFLWSWATYEPHTKLPDECAYLCPWVLLRGALPTSGAVQQLFWISIFGFASSL